MELALTLDAPRNACPSLRYVAKSTTCSRAAVAPKLSWPTWYLPFCTPGMIVANVPFCTFQLTPSTLATALRRSTSRPTFWPLTWPASGRPEVPGEMVGPRISWPLDRTLAGSSAFSFGSAAIPETTSWAGMAVEPADGEAVPGSLAALLAAAADAELVDELQPASAIA